MKKKINLKCEPVKVVLPLKIVIFIFKVVHFHKQYFSEYSTFIKLHLNRNYKERAESLD